MQKISYFCLLTRNHFAIEKFARVGRYHVLVNVGPIFCGKICERKDRFLDHSKMKVAAMQK